MVGISTNLTASLLGSEIKKSDPKIYDVISGNSGDMSDVLTSAFSSNLSISSNLTETQSSKFSDLESYILDNVEDESVRVGLLSDLNAVKGIIELGNPRTNLDPVFSLLAGIQNVNESVIENPTGLLIDNLI